jgi:hypothetical protein
MTKGVSALDEPADVIWAESAAGPDAAERTLEMASYVARRVGVDPSNSLGEGLTGDALTWKSKAEGVMWTNSGEEGSGSGVPCDRQLSLVRRAEARIDIPAFSAQFPSLSFLRP